jgi:8-oxo-dGTP diphosphatase
MTDDVATETVGNAERRRTRVAAYALVMDDKGRVLLCRTAPGVVQEQTWLLPGGGLEFGESPEAAVVRELQEEAGLDGVVERLVDVSDRIMPNLDGADQVHAIRIIYRVTITGGALRDEADGSTDTCAWLNPTDAERLNLSELARRALAWLATDADAER